MKLNVQLNIQKRGECVGKSISKIVYRQPLSNPDDCFNFVFNEIRLKSLPNDCFPPGKLHCRRTDLSYPAALITKSSS